MPDRSAAQRAEESAQFVVQRGRRLVQEDRYVLVLLLILLTILSSAFLGDGALGLAVSLSFVVLTLVVTLSTSDAGPRARWIGGVTAGLTVVGVLAAELLGYGGVARLLYGAAMGVISVLTPIVIARRIARHPIVNINTVAGAASIYLLIGLLFSVIFSLVGMVNASASTALLVEGANHLDAANAFFVSSRPTIPGDFIYFSFVTLTTVGYGDLTSAIPLGRMLSVTEALFGQLYLVIVVALLVSNIGHVRHAPRPDEPSP